MSRSAAASPSSRPAPKPPYDDGGYPLERITRMRVEAWREQLLKSPSFLLAKKGNIQRAAQMLHTLEFGADIGFTGARDIIRTARNLRSATRDPAVEALVTAQIEADVAAGTKMGPFDTPPFEHYSVSPIGAVPKVGRSWDRIRVIHHLSYPFGGDSINASIGDDELELGRFDHACAAIRKLGPGCQLVKLDVLAAYRTVPVRPKDRPLLGLRWKGKYYFELVLPFGLKSSGARWELFASALHYFFQHHLGIELVIHYVDDYLFVVASEEAGQRARADAILLAARLGLDLSQKALGPACVLAFLGIELDTLLMEMRLPAAKLADLRQLLKEWQGKIDASIHDLQSLHGKLRWAAQCVRPGRAFLRRIIDFTTSLSGAREAGELATEEEASSSSRHRLTPAVRGDIDWWQRFLDRWNGKSLLYELQWQTNDGELQLFTDASLTGYGAAYGRRWLQGRWSGEQLADAWRMRRATYSMPFLELYAIVLAVQTWGHEWRTRRITIRSDCQPVVHACNTLGAKHPNMQALLRQLAMTAAEGGFELRFEHLPGVTNVAADLLSRTVPVAYSQLAKVLPGARRRADKVRALPAPLAQL